MFDDEYDRDPDDSAEEEQETLTGFPQPLDMLLKLSAASQIVPVPKPWLPPGFPGGH